MKYITQIIILSLLIFSNVSAENRDNELNNLFKKLKNSENTKAIEIENKIWKIENIEENPMNILRIP